MAAADAAESREGKARKDKKKKELLERLWFRHFLLFSVVAFVSGNQYKFSNDPWRPILIWQRWLVIPNAQKVLHG